MYITLFMDDLKKGKKKKYFSAKRLYSDHYDKQQIFALRCEVEVGKK